MSGMLGQQRTLRQQSVPVMILLCSPSIAASSWRTLAAQKSILSTSPAAENAPITLCNEAIHAQPIYSPPQATAQ